MKWLQKKKEKKVMAICGYFFSYYSTKSAVWCLNSTLENSLNSAQFIQIDAKMKKYKRNMLDPRGMATPNTYLQNCGLY